ncbi:2-oxoacid:acceptor oxidoreductase family protein [Fodinicola acaciae]|uniref:2-oxoacid:acceptor oxidoreductase family protein n=1 Tax=Fodinicola acaciae TaxID=2681555 RepID=UPI0013D14B97|nr:2-oxoacid:acceptor oxidoreductase family protein [Fodinicola acaciae]
MFEIRLHGRGGQGVVTTAELLSVAAFRDGRHAQAFPSFGPERTGAPVTAFCRIGERPIRGRDPVTHPDALIVQDASLLHQVDLFAGLEDDAYLLINSSRGLGDLGLADFAAGRRPDRLLVVPATTIALDTLGRPLPGTALLGGFTAVTGEISLSAVHAAIADRFAGAVAEANHAAAERAYAFGCEEQEKLRHVAAD